MQAPSHAFPINPPPVERLEDDPVARVVTRSPQNETAAGQRTAYPGTAGELATAFSEFIGTSVRLENYYRQLQDEVTALRLELSAQNAALQGSLAENRRMHLHLEQIVDCMPCGVLVIDRSGFVTMINPESVRLLALDGSLLTSRKPITLEDISAQCGINLRAWHQNSPSEQVSQEFCLHDPSGNRWIEIRDRRLVSQEGEVSDPEQMIFIMRDVTRQRRDEQERIAGRKAMALAEMTTILAHEVRNPLGSLELFAELIEGDTENRAKWISNLRAGLRSLAATANNVLCFHGSAVLHLNPISLSAVIEKAIEFVQPLASQATVSLEWAGTQDRSIVMGNDCALQQVILNLMSNAIRHTPAGGKVKISLKREHEKRSSLDCRRTNEEVVVEFADTGCGIRPDHVERIFEPGFSGSGDTSGLGLAVCQQIMKQHNGNISVASCNSSGARFELLFPLLTLEAATA